MSALSEAFADHPDGTVVVVWAVPGANRTEVTGVHDGALRVRVAAPAEGGKANRALSYALAEVFGVRRVELVTGSWARRKRFLIPGVTTAEAVRRIR